MFPLFTDNHLIAVNKRAGDIVQGDKTGDAPLTDRVKAYLKERFAKPGNVYLGLVHRLDRPVSGVLLMGRTSKATARLSAMFAQHDRVRKVYWALVSSRPEADEATLVHWLTRQEKTNTARAFDHEVTGAKRASLHYKVIGRTQSYHLIEVELHTGRHHQIRCQLAAIGCPIKGDLKYGARRSNPSGGISLHARRLEFEHPVTHELITIEAPLPEDWPEVTLSDGIQPSN